MYTRFYGLREKPFSLTPDPRFLFLSEAHREALAHLLYGIGQGEGFIAVTGEVGSGKTTLCRTLLERLDAGTEVAFIFHPQLSGLELLQAINAELGLPHRADSRRDLIDSLNQFLLAKKLEDRRVLVIVDEAQTLERDALEQLRLLSNLETETEKLIQIILLGQPELDAVLELPDHRQLRQRITVRWRLGALSPAETRDYVDHRLRVAAGAKRQVFTRGGLAEVVRRSQGVPRLVNALCDRALLVAYAAGRQDVDRRIVRHAARELRGDSAGRPSRHRFAFGFAGGLVVLMLAVGAWWLLGRPGLPNLVAAWSPAAPALNMAQEGRPQLSSTTSLAEPVDPIPKPLASEVATAFSAPDLGELLARTSPARTSARSVAALLEAWGLEPPQTELLSLAQGLATLREHGLHYLSFETASLALLQTLDQPALLVIPALDGAPRAAVLRGVDAGSALLLGLGPEPIRMPLVELAYSWQGEAYVPWRDFAVLPDVLRPGSEGRGVSWLQEALRGFGLYAGEPSGVYDDTTRTAVRAFQEVTGLQVDGTVGPETKIRLYQLSDAHEVPRLSAGANHGTAVQRGAAS